MGYKDRFNLLLGLPRGAVPDRAGWKTIEIAASKKVAFTPAKQLKDAVNG